MTQDAEFYEGFDTHGPAGFVPVRDGVLNPSQLLIGGKWTSLWSTGFATDSDVTLTVAAALAGTGQALTISHDSPQDGTAGISRTLDGSYQRFVGSFHFRLDAMHSDFQGGVTFGDGSTDQFSLTVEASGQIGFRRGSVRGTLVAVSDESARAGVDNVMLWDGTIHNSAGIVKVWLNGLLTSLNLTGQDTQSSLSASANAVRLMLASVNGGGGMAMTFDHFWGFFYASGGGGETPPMTNAIVETQFPIGDDAVDFAVGAALLGPDYSTTTSTNAPGAGQLVLRQFTPDVDGTLDRVAILPAAASVVAKFKACAYADSAGSPGALLSDGVEVIGCAAGVALVSDLVTPQAFAAGVPIWIGVYGDTSIALHLTDSGVLGRKIARTYASGAPATAGAMTVNLPSWVIYGLASGVADQWSVIDNNPFSPISYVEAGSAGDHNLHVFPILSSTPTTIYGLAVSAIIWRTDAGARTIDLLTKSAAVTDEGLSPGQAPPTSPGLLESYWRVDPDTSAAWNASGVNLALHGLGIAT